MEKVFFFVATLVDSCWKHFCMKRSSELNLVQISSASHLLLIPYFSDILSQTVKSWNVGGLLGKRVKKEGKTMQGVNEEIQICVGRSAGKKLSLYNFPW